MVPGKTMQAGVSIDKKMAITIGPRTLPVTMDGMLGMITAMTSLTMQKSLTMAKTTVSMIRAMQIHGESHGAMSHCVQKCTKKARRMMTTSPHRFKQPTLEISRSRRLKHTSPKQKGSTTRVKAKEKVSPKVNGTQAKARDHEFWRRQFNVSLEDRRKRQAEFKTRTKCQACGQRGHWAEDPGCPKYGGSGMLRLPTWARQEKERHPESRVMG